MPRSVSGAQPGRPAGPSTRAQPPTSSTGRTPAWQRLAMIAVPLVLLGAMLVYTFWPNPDPASCVVAIDAKGSTKKMAAQYADWWPEQAEKCAVASGGRIVVVPVTSDTGTTAVPIQTLDLSDPEDVPNLSDNPYNASKQRKEALEAWAPKVNAAIFGKIEQAPGGTDLLSLARVVAPLLAAQGGDRSLIVLTDGMNNREPYRFKDPNLDMSPAGIAQLIQTLQATGQIPSLADVTVSMYGVDRGTQSSGEDPARLRQIQDFWNAYFAAAGANLRAYQQVKP